MEDCRARLQYLREALEIETKKEAGVRHLKETYADNMPAIVEVKRNGRVMQASVKRTRGTEKKASPLQPKRAATSRTRQPSAGR